VAEKLMDAGNLAFAGLLFSQLIGEKPFDVLLGAVGLSLWLILLAVGALMMYLFPGE
jgi:hypothetical protein